MSALWRMLASPVTSVLLALAVAGAVLAATLIPQGTEAMALAREAHAVELHHLAGWGLTELYTSHWFHALLVLVAGNLLAVTLTATRSAHAKAALGPPSGAPITHDLEAARPEIAVEVVRGLFADRLAIPSAEAAEGARARLVFDVGTSGRIAPALAHAGLMALVLGASLGASTGDGGRVPRAILDITDVASRARGTFDIVAGEPFKFFQSPVKYTLREYVPSREGLGPAVRFERVVEGEDPRDFWVYGRAPVGFDGRHRGGDVSMEARWLGATPKPGKGLASSGYAGAMAGGLALIGLSLGASRRSRGRVWVEVDGERVKVSAVPELAADRAFEASVARAVTELRAALAQA